MVEKDIYILMDEDVPSDDEILKAVEKHMKPKTDLPDKYGDLSVYSTGLNAFMSGQAKEALYGSGEPKKPRVTIKDQVLPVVSDIWASTNDIAHKTGLNNKRVHEALRAAMDRGEVTRSPMMVNGMRRGFQWKLRHENEPAEYTQSFEVGEPGSDQQEPIEDEFHRKLAFAEPYHDEVEAMRTAVEIPQEVEEPEVAPAMPTATPPTGAETAVLGDFLTRKGMGTASIEMHPTDAQEVVQEGLVQAVVTGSVPMVSEGDQIEQDLKGIFADTDFRRLIQRVIVEGPANITRKIKILGVLGHVLAQTSKGATYSKELFEVAEFLDQFDELKRHY